MFLSPPGLYLINSSHYKQKLTFWGGCADFWRDSGRECPLYVSTFNQGEGDLGAEREVRDGDKDLPIPFLNFLKRFIYLFI